MLLFTLLQYYFSILRRRILAAYPIISVIAPTDMTDKKKLNTTRVGANAQFSYTPEARIVTYRTHTETGRMSQATGYRICLPFWV